MLLREVASFNKFETKKSDLDTADVETLKKPP